VFCAHPSGLGGAVDEEVERSLVTLAGQLGERHLEPAIGFSTDFGSEVRRRPPAGFDQRCGCESDEARFCENRWRPELKLEVVTRRWYSERCNCQGGQGGNHRKAPSSQGSGEYRDEPEGDNQEHKGRAGAGDSYAEAVFAECCCLASIHRFVMGCGWARPPKRPPELGVC
jgi:hypothetical protein